LRLGARRLTGRSVLQTARSVLVQVCHGLHPSRPSRNGTGPYGPSDSGRRCVLPVGTDRPARRRPAAATARRHRADSLPSLGPTKRRGQSAATSLRPYQKRKPKVAAFAGRFLFKATPAAPLPAAFSLWRILSESDIVLGPRCAPSIMIPLGGGTWVHHHQAAACAAASALCAHAHRASFRLPTTGPGLQPERLSRCPSPARRLGRPRTPILAPRSGRSCLQPAFDSSFKVHPARPALSTAAHSADSACLPAFPVTLPQPARTAPCRRIPVTLAPRPVTGRPPCARAAAAVGRAAGVPIPRCLARPPNFKALIFL
jgi:hypothetical protein